MREVHTDVITFRGSHYDFGYKQGKLLLDSPLLINREKLWKKKRERRTVIDIDQSIKLLNRFIPLMEDEIQGLADALQWDFKDTLREFGGLYVDYNKSGCSIFSSDSYMVRNYDSHPSGYEGRFLVYHPTDKGYATIGPSMQITGRTDGMNEKGLVIGYNFVNRIRSGYGFICQMISRMILETCENIDDAIQLLKEIPHSMSFNYALMDASGRSVIIEASPRNVSVREGNVSTNHFEILTEENRYRTSESQYRERILLEKDITLNQKRGFLLMNDPKENVFSSKYDAWSGTLHTTLYDPVNKTAWYAIGGKSLPVIFNFQQFLDGKNIYIKKIKGEIDYTMPFLNEVVF